MIGYHKFVKHPKLVISDQSMVFTLAALKEFKNEDLADFLKCSYKKDYAKGEARVSECMKTKVSLCKGFFMNLFTLYVLTDCLS